MLFQASDTSGEQFSCSILYNDGSVGFYNIHLKSGYIGYSRIQISTSGVVNYEDMGTHTQGENINILTYGLEF